MAYTATEIAYRMRATDLALSEKDFAVLCHRLDEVLLQQLIDVALYGKAATAYGVRHVGAKRARKLRRRGEHVFLSNWTPKGKARYSWVRAVRIVL